jgi:Ca2+:H+ antiporter
MLKPRLNWLLALFPVAVVLEVLHAAPVAVFTVAALGILPLAGIIGHATEDLAIRSGPKIGGLLNATFGNVTELIISFFLILRGETEVVKASITGSIIGNVLLVLGLAFVVGGWNRKEQTFNRAAAGLHSASLLIAVVGLLMPAIFHFTPESTRFRTETVSVGVAIVLMCVYGLSLLFTFKTHSSLFGSTEDQGDPQWSRNTALGMLFGATVLVAILSEFLVGALEPTVAKLGISKLFVGLIIVPIVGNAAEHSSAVLLAARDKMDVAMEIAIGSSTQIALFVAPVLIFLSLIVGKPMNFIFTGFEIAAVAIASAVLGFIVLDGRSNWFEGAQMLAAYTIMALSFFFL